MGLGMLISRLRHPQFTAFVVDIEVTLARPVDAISPVEAGIKPLRGVGGRHLHGEHMAVLVKEGAGVFFG